MNLDDYFKQYEKPIYFSKRTGIPNSSLSFWRFGKRPIPIDKMVLIEKKTNNLVTRKDLCKNWHEIWPELNTDNR